MYKWDEMEQRERDALVAEKVMGWTRTRDIDDFAVVFAYDDNPYHSRTAGYDFSPSTNISAAWEVVEKLKPDYIFELRVGSLSESARFTSFETGSEFIAQCKKASESITLAALRAIGVDIK